jgi:hypothetical protein
MKRGDWNEFVSKTTNRREKQMNTKEEKGMTHEEIAVAARAAIKERGWDVPVSKREIFDHLIDEYPVLTAAIVRGINEAWEDPHFERLLRARKGP